MTSTSAQPELKRRQLVQILFGLQLSLLLAAIDQTVVTTAIPNIVAQLHGFEKYSWVTSIYLLMSTVATPIFGRLSDFYGRKLILLLGLALFVFASWLCGMAGVWTLPFPGMTQLIMARALQGLAGGMIMTITFTVVADIFSAAERGKYQGIFAAVFALAAIAGPTLGGYLTDNFSWRWAFFINIPVGLLAIAVLYAALPEHNCKQPLGRVDYAGVLALLGFLLPFMLAVDQLRQKAGTQVPAWALLAVSAVFLGVLIVTQKRVPDPILPLALFKLPVVSLSLLSVFVSGIGMFGSLLLIPLFMQTVSGLSAVSSGLFLTPLMVIVAVFSIVSGQLVAANGKYKRLILAGWLLMTLGTVVLSTVTAQSQLTLILAAMLVSGAGLGILLPLYTIVIQSAVPESMLGIATGLTQFFRTVGGAVGTAIFGAVMIACYQMDLSRHLPQSMSSGKWTFLSNPLDANYVRQQLFSILSGLPDGKQLVVTIFQQCQESLVYAIDKVFLIYALILTVTMLVNVFLPQLPLRGKVR